MDIVMPEQSIQWRLDKGVAHLALCRVSKRNALRLADWRDFGAALVQAAEAGAKVAVIHSAERGIFSAGSDLSELSLLAGKPEGRIPFAVAMDEVMRLLADGPMVTIAAISGACHGAGVAIAMACNIRVAEPTAAFAIPPARFGISYPVSDIRRLVGLVGPGQAARLLYCAEQIDSVEALRIRLVEMIAPNALERSNELAEMTSANSSDSVALIKKALSVETVSPTTDTQFIEGFATSDFQEFVARRQ